MCRSAVICCGMCDCMCDCHLLWYAALYVRLSFVVVCCVVCAIVICCGMLRCMCDCHLSSQDYSTLCHYYVNCFFGLSSYMTIQQSLSSPVVNMAVRV
jgi:hypothetical protein